MQEYQEGITHNIDNANIDIGQWDLSSGKQKIINTSERNMVGTNERETTLQKRENMENF